MIKKVSCIILIIICILVSGGGVQAANATVVLTPNNSKVKQGEKLTVTLAINCSEGINGVADIKCEYNKELLELESSEIKDKNFINIGTEEKVELMCNSTDKITKSNIYIFNFKVKDAAKIGETELKINNLIVDSDAGANSETKIPMVSTKVTIESKEDKKSEENKPEENKPEENKPEENKQEDKKTETKKAEEKNTESKKKLPKTGIGAKVGIAIVGLIIISGVCFARYKYININK